MSKSLKYILIGIILLTCSVVILTVLGKYKASDLKDSSFGTLFIKDIRINVEIADTPEKKSRGLSARPSLSGNDGMLFPYTNTTVIPAFWMKGMLIPLDIIWIKDKKIIQIDHNVKIPDRPDSLNNLTLYRPAKPIDYVLEVNAGFSERNGIVVGDEVTIN